MEVTVFHSAQVCYLFSFLDHFGVPQWPMGPVERFIYTVLVQRMPCNADAGTSARVGCRIERRRRRRGALWRCQQSPWGTSGPHSSPARRFEAPSRHRSSTTRERPARATQAAADAARWSRPVCRGLISGRLSQSNRILGVWQNETCCENLNPWISRSERSVHCAGAQTTEPVSTVSDCVYTRRQPIVRRLILSVTLYIRP